MSERRPALPERFEYRLDLANQVTPQLLRQEPIHRWFYFQHSFSPQLVEHLLDTFELGAGALIADPFVGAGTTLAVARRRGMDAVGTDVSPLSVFVSNAKVQGFDRIRLRAGLEAVMVAVDHEGPASEVGRAPRLKKAFTDAEFAVLERLRGTIARQPCGERESLLLALLSTARRFSRAVPDGGWFRWRDLPSGEREIPSRFRRSVEEMLEDSEHFPENSVHCRAYLHDARELTGLRERAPILAAGCDAIITSPPYPNRHDYTRICQIELLMLGMTEEEVFELRRDSLRSHVEARWSPDRRKPYVPPDRLLQTLDRLPGSELDSRVRPMLAGYFEDLATVLASCHQLLKPKGHLALVVGNVRHGGVMIPVDEILIGMGEAAGLTLMDAWVARLRGNSAQQMGRFGREPARESVLTFRAPASTGGEHDGHP